jgi:hypothetical protein
LSGTEEINVLAALDMPAASTTVPNHPPARPCLTGQCRTVESHSETLSPHTELGTDDLEDAGPGTFEVGKVVEVGTFLTKDIQPKSSDEGGPLLGDEAKLEQVVEREIRTVTEDHPQTVSVENDGLLGASTLGGRSPEPARTFFFEGTSDRVHGSSLLSRSRLPVYKPDRSISAEKPKLPRSTIYGNRRNPSYPGAPYSVPSRYGTLTNVKRRF